MAKGWDRTQRLPIIELRGKTVLVIGLGGIGTQVAERCFAFGMRVIAALRNGTHFTSNGWIWSSHPLIVFSGQWF